MPQFLIVAYGNTLRSDDGVAWRAAELLRAVLSPSVAGILCVHQLVPEIAENISHVEHAIFIDASVNGAPGEIASTAINSNRDWTPASHRLSPDQILALCKYAYGSAPSATIVSVAGECFEHGEKLSASVEVALPKLVDTVIEVIQRYGTSSVKGMTPHHAEK
ncbi:MAG TPA: hydrogenase maturation protease [Terracidiphilus sp.]|nr:hydrogenase maturation protease [Terracidiphilus sp.]